MIEHNAFAETPSRRPLRKAPLAAALSLMAAGMASPAMAEVAFESDNGWKVGVNGHLPIFAVFGDYDKRAGGDFLDGEDSFSITTGFNPATLQTNIYAPMQNGLQVSGHFQMNASIAPGDADEEFRSRVSEIAVAGDFGTVNIGKGFGIFGTPAIGDSGSGMGVGLIGAGPDQVAATAGRIGNGYFYADFQPRVMYTSNNLGGLQFKVGVFSPSKVDSTTAGGANAEYDTPRIEANVVYSADNFSLWSSGFSQDVGSKTGTNQYTMSGIDFGGSVSLGDLAVRGNYSMTSGTGNGVFAARFDPNEEDANQWYVETTYQINRTTLGASYGEGEDDFEELNGAGAGDSDLTMLFARYAATDNFTLLAEYQIYGTGDGDGEYNAIIFGSQLTF
ncbi:porin [Marinobacter sp. M3C]|jgi:predicted porin|uniref:porin n=2 Tax=unclassified Marinobacter TaxID=83889 RepID=UPI00201022C5|nr:porin [Marinobacter sp. M3C]